MKTLPKGKAKAKAKTKTRAGSSKDTPLTKGKQKNALNKKALDDLGELSLKERIKKATEGAETAEEAVLALKKQLTPKEQQSAWSKMKTKMKNDPAEAKKVENMSKKEIGIYATMCLLKAEAPKFMALKQELNSGVSLTKGNMGVRTSDAAEIFQRRAGASLGLWSSEVESRPMDRGMLPIPRPGGHQENQYCHP